MQNILKLFTSWKQLIFIFHFQNPILAVIKHGLIQFQVDTFSPVFRILGASQRLLAEDTLPAPFSPSLQLVQVIAIIWQKETMIQ